MASSQESALQSDIPPNSKSDNQWLHSMNYPSLQDFAISFGFRAWDPEDLNGARSLLRQFRDEQQVEWEKRQRERGLSSSSTAVGEQRRGENQVELGAKEKEEKVKKVMLWHQRMGHAAYQSVLALPKSSSSFPDDFEGVVLGDLPPCEGCARAGEDPFADKW